MKTLKIISGLSTAFLMTASATTVFAEGPDTSHVRSQEHTRSQLNLEIPTNDFGQSLNQEQHTVMNQNQNQYRHQYQYRNNHQNKNGDSGQSAIKTQNKANNSWQGNNGASAMNRMNTMNRYMHNNSRSGSMNRTNTASRSMGGGRR
jgi:hypothetical protein